MSDTILPCRHRRTVYNERDETLFCLSCGCWVLPEDSALGQRLKELPQRRSDPREAL